MCFSLNCATLHNSLTATPSQDLKPSLWIPFHLDQLFGPSIEVLARHCPFSALWRLSSWVVIWRKYIDFSKEERKEGTGQETRDGKRRQRGMQNGWEVTVRLLRVTATRRATWQVLVKGLNLPQIKQAARHMPSQHLGDSLVYKISSRIARATTLFRTKQNKMITTKQNKNSLMSKLWFDLRLESPCNSQIGVKTSEINQIHATH